MNTFANLSCSCSLACRDFCWYLAANVHAVFDSSKLYLFFLSLSLSKLFQLECRAACQQTPSVYQAFETSTKARQCKRCSSTKTRLLHQVAFTKTGTHLLLLPRPRPANPLAEVIAHGLKAEVSPQRTRCEFMASNLIANSSF